MSVSAAGADRHAALLADMRLALLGEHGARALYERMARQLPDVELARVFAALADEEARQIERLRGLMARLGRAGPARSRRRTLTAALVALVGRLAGPRVVLRLCEDAESTIARWYAAYASHLARVGEMEAARLCEELSLTKQRHAQVLTTFLEHGVRRARGPAGAREDASDRSG